MIKSFYRTFSFDIIHLVIFMKKILFIVFSMFLMFGYVNADNYMSNYAILTNRCSVIKDNEVVIPVIVRTLNDVKLSKLINEYNLDYVDNYEDVLSLNIRNISTDKIDIYVDYNRDSDGRSLIKYKVNEDIEIKSNEELVSFDLVVKVIKDFEINKINVLGNDIVLSDDGICESINDFKITEVERVKYVDLSEVDHSKYFNDIISKIIIGVLSISLIVCIILLIRKKK